MGAQITTGFFGGHGNKMTASSSPTTPHFNIGNGRFRMWDTNTQWRKFEPTTKNSYNWVQFDRTVQYCVDNNLHITYCYGQPPNWATGGTSSSIHGTDYNTLVPTNMQDWSDMVDAVAARLPLGSWHEHVNEPNGLGFYSGTKAQLATMHGLLWDRAKLHDPTAKVITAAPSSINAWEYHRGYLDSVVAKTDMIGMHGYCFSFTPPKEPEAIFHAYERYRAMATAIGFSPTIPIIDTEYTWYDYTEIGGAFVGGASNVLMSDTLASSYVARSIFCHWLAGYTAQFHYMLDFDWSTIQFVTNLATPTTLSVAGLTWQYVATTLEGGYLWGFRERNQQYLASFQHRDGRHCTIRWMRDAATEIIDTTGYATVVDCRGNNVTKSASYSLTLSPVFCYHS
jgi:hypothetical protein